MVGLAIIGSRGVTVAVGAGKPYVAAVPKSFLGQTVGNGQCVTYVKAASGAPPSSEWSAGKKVRGQFAIKPGTAIATFQDGKYWNHTDGTSHGAIYMAQDKGGIYVVDQWKGQPVHARYVKFRGGEGHPVNDGDAFSVVLAGAAHGGHDSYLGYRIGDVDPSNEDTPDDVWDRIAQATRYDSTRAAIHSTALVFGFGLAAAGAGYIYVRATK